MINLSFLTSLLIFIIITVFITYLSGKRTNRCFKDFSKYPVTVITKDKAVWGDFYPESTGFYIKYKKPKKEKNFKELSYLFYKQEFEEIIALTREVSELNELQKRKREREIERTYKPTILRKLKRYLYNIVIIASDVIKEALSLTLGRVLSRIPQNLPSQKGYSSKISQLLVPTSSYDGLLEKIIGKKVILEIKDKDGYKEHPGIFKEYTKDFLEVLNVNYSYTIKVKIFPEKEVEFKDIKILAKNEKIYIKNQGTSPIEVIEINRAIQNFSINPGEEREIEVKYKNFIRIVMKITIIGDIIVPRSIGIIRHEAE